MFSNFRRGLDSRDSRLDTGFALGDDSIPDDVSWDLRDRDKTCVWLEFIDIQFDECVVTEVVNKDNKTISNSEKYNTFTQPIFDNKPAIEVCVTTATMLITPVSENSFSISNEELHSATAVNIITPTEVVCITNNQTTFDKKERKNVVTTSRLNKNTKVVKVENQTIRR
jgi:hypothetical protein